MFGWKPLRSVTGASASYCCVFKTGGLGGGRREGLVDVTPIDFVVGMVDHEESEVIRSGGLGSNHEEGAGGGAARSCEHVLGLGDSVHECDAGMLVLSTGCSGLPGHSRDLAGSGSRNVRSKSGLARVVHEQQGYQADAYLHFTTYFY